MPVRVPDRYLSLRSRAEHGRVNATLARLFREHGARRAAIKLHEGPVASLYLADLDIWLAAHALANRHRNALGPGDPVGRRNLWPIVQLNLALAPGSARPQARFVRDADDRIWIAHTGTLGGRQPGISRTGFLAVVGGAREVTIDDAPERLLVLGTFADPSALLLQIARLTHLSSDYRNAVAAGLTPSP